MGEGIDAQHERWVQLLAACPKRGIDLGKGPLRVDETADLSAEGFWSWMEAWFAGDAQGADQLGVTAPQGEPKPAVIPVVRQLAFSF